MNDLLFNYCLLLKNLYKPNLTSNSISGINTRSINKLSKRSIPSRISIKYDSKTHFSYVIIRLITHWYLYLLNNSITSSLQLSTPLPPKPLTPQTIITTHYRHNYLLPLTIIFFSPSSLNSKLFTTNISYHLKASHTHIQLSLTTGHLSSFLPFSTNHVFIFLKPLPFAYSFSAYTLFLPPPNTFVPYHKHKRLEHPHQFIPH